MATSYFKDKRARKYIWRMDVQGVRHPSQQSRPSTPRILPRSGPGKLFRQDPHQLWRGCQSGRPRTERIWFRCLWCTLRTSATWGGILQGTGCTVSMCHPCNVYGTVRRFYAPPFAPFNKISSYYGVVADPSCVLPYKYRKILEMLSKLMEVVGNNGEATREGTHPTAACRP